jgi:hypothetical protein
MLLEHLLDLGRHLILDLEEVVELLVKLILDLLIHVDSLGAEQVVSLLRLYLGHNLVY